MLALAVALRLFRLDHLSIWGDEGFSVLTARLGLPEMMAVLIDDWNHPPLHYLLLHGWFQLFGDGALQARLLPALFGSLAVATTFFLARNLFDTRTAQLSALLLAISQISVAYSQEVRPYSQLMFATTATTYLFVRGLRDRSAAFWAGFVLAAILAVYTHYYAVFVLAVLLPFAALRQRRYGVPGAWVAAAWIAVPLALVPWALVVVPSFVESTRIDFSSVPPPWFAVDRLTLIQDHNAFNNGRVHGVLKEHAPLWTYAAGGLLFGAPLLLSLRSLCRRDASERGRTERENVALLGLLWLPPIVLLVLLAHFRNVQYDVRYVSFCMVPYYILVASGIARMRPAPLRAATVVAIVVLGAYALRANYFFPYKEDYRGALAQLAGGYRASDCVLFTPGGGLPRQWSVYHFERVAPELRRIDPGRIGAGLDGCRRVWSVEYRRVGSAIERSRSALAALDRRYARTRHWEFHWVHLGLYTPR